MSTNTEKPLVLVVDDEPHNIHMLATILAAECRTVFAISGEQALARVRERPVDIILLDVMLPGIDGFEVCQALKEDPATAGIPVIFVSGLTEEADEERGFELGAVDYIHKPFQPAVVRARVRTHLRLQALLLELETLARTDRLTRIGNRRHFEERAEIEIDRSRRYRLPMSLVVFDLDYFKRINDQFGHGAGDDVLVEMVERLQPELRKSDLLVRWGGEEFAMLMPSAPIGPAIELAERLRIRIATKPFPQVGLVTASFGVAEYRDEEAVEPWFDRADRALYRAKKEGRNRVMAVDE